MMKNLFAPSADEFPCLVASISAQNVRRLASLFHRPHRGCQISPALVRVRQLRGLGLFILLCCIHLSLTCAFAVIAELAMRAVLMSQISFLLEDDPRKSHETIAMPTSAASRVPESRVSILFLNSVFGVYCAALQVQTLHASYGPVSALGSIWVILQPHS